ncbi:MAG: hypothetical protein QM698_08715 [Micropepsaceae bacterium]
MAQQVHYELFVRRGASPGWSLQEAGENRAEILEAAEATLASGSASAVKVMKETYDEATGDFMSLRILEEGQKLSFKVAKAAEYLPSALPCLTPEDLYSAHARNTLGRLFADVLSRWKLTVTELIHRADMLEKLEATGTLFQHAVQKIAIAQSNGGGNLPLPQAIRAITDLADRAIKRVYREDRARRIMTPQSIAEMNAYAEAKAAAADGAFLIGLALAQYLKPATTWSDKLDRVLALIATPPQEERAAQIVIALADAIVGELLGGAAALQEVLGPVDDLGGALVAMSDLYLGRVPPNAPHLALGRLAGLFAAGHLLDARTALARRVLAELKTHKRLAPSVETELAHLRAITSRLVQGPTRLVPHEDIVGAVTLRSNHLVQSAPITDYLAGAEGPLAIAGRLIAFEINIVGAANKRRIWDYLKPVLANATFDQALMAEGVALTRLARAAGLQSALLKSALSETARTEGAKIIDAAARRTLDLPRLQKLLADPAKGPAAIVQYAQALNYGGVPKGACETALAELVRRAARAVAA